MSCPAHGYRSLLLHAVLTMLAVLLVSPTLANATTTHHQGAPLIIGILAHRSIADVEARWEPLADYLGVELGGVPVHIKALPYEALTDQISRHGVDLVLTNPSHYIELRRRNPLSGALLTLAPESGGLALSSFGGTIFTRADRDDIKQLDDLKGLRIAAVSKSSLGGYQVQTVLLGERGIVTTDSVAFLGMPHDRIVDAVLAGEYDVGFVRSGLIEAMQAEGRLERDTLRVLNEQNLPGFPHAVSTRLYPEWPLFATPHANPGLVRRVATALLRLEPDSETARAVGIHGFNFPADYQPVEEVLRRLRLPPFDAPPVVQWRDVWNQHRHELTTAAIAIALLLAAIARMAMLTRTTRRANRRFDHLFKAVPTPIVMIKGGVIVDCNRAAARVLGLAGRQHMIGKSPAQLSPPRQADGEDSAIKSSRIMERVLAGEPCTFDWTHLHADGSPRTLEVSLLRLDTSGKRHILGVWHDVTDRHQAHQLLASELALFSNGPVMVFEWALQTDWPILSVSRNVTDELGYTPEVMAAADFNFADLLHPDDRERIRQDSIACIAGRKDSWEQSYRLRRKSGDYAWFYDYTQAVRDEEGKALALRGYLIDQTTTKQLELQLAQERKSLFNIVWGTGVGTWEWNVRTGETRFNDRWAEIIGYTLDELAPVSIETWLRHVHPKDLARSEEALKRHFEGHADHYECEVRMRHRDGNWVWVLDRGKVVEWTEDGQPLWMAGTHLEITARKRTQAQHRALVHALSNAGTMLMVVDGAQTVRYMNRTMKAQFGNRVGQSCIGLVGEIEQPFDMEDLARVIEGKTRVHYRARTHDGLTLDVIAVPYTHTDGTPCRLEVIRDVTVEHEQQRELEHIAYHDALTGLANRPLLSDRMQQAMLDARRRGQLVAIAYIDLDGFKEVNDRHGHPSGDALLATIARRMRVSLRGGDTVARIGGDEFAVVLRDLATPAAAQPLVERLLETIAKPATVLGHQVKVSASIGVSFFPQGEDINADQLLLQADEAMYVAKTSGKNQISIFRSHTNACPENPA